MLDPLLSAVLKRQAPQVEVLDVRDSSSGLTTYTFTSCNVHFGSVHSIAGDAYGTDPHVRSPGRKMIVVVVHGDDSASSFGVNSVTIGAVAGTERVDRAGITNPPNTAIYTWDTNSLDGITSTDIAVTWSEAITACAIGVLLVSNLGLCQFVNSATAAATTALDLAPAASVTGFDTFAIAICGSSCATGGGTETARITHATTGSGQVNGDSCPILLYSNSNALLDYCAFWSYSQQYLGDVVPFRMTVNWSSTGNSDAVMATFV